MTFGRGYITIVWNRKKFISIDSIFQWFQRFPQRKPPRIPPPQWTPIILLVNWISLCTDTKDMEMFFIRGGAGRSKRLAFLFSAVIRRFLHCSQLASSHASDVTSARVTNHTTENPYCESLDTCLCVVGHKTGNPLVATYNREFLQVTRREAGNPNDVCHHWTHNRKFPWCIRTHRQTQPPWCVM